MKQFNEEGPGSVGQDMDRGIKLMDIFQTRFEEVDKVQTDLGKVYLYHSRKQYN